MSSRPNSGSSRAGRPWGGASPGSRPPAGAGPAGRARGGCAGAGAADGAEAAAACSPTKGRSVEPGPEPTTSCITRCPVRARSSAPRPGHPDDRAAGGEVGAERGLQALPPPPQPLTLGGDAPPRGGELEPGGDRVEPAPLRRQLAEQGGPQPRGATVERLAQLGEP